MENWKERRKKFLIFVTQYAKSHNKNVEFGKVGDKIGVGFRLCKHLAFNFRDVNGTVVYWVKSKSIWCEVITVGKYFECLFKNRDKIQAEFDGLGYKLIWDKVENRQLHRIRISQNAYLEQEGNWEEYSEWLTSLAERFVKIFPKHLIECNLEC